MAPTSRDVRTELGPIHQHNVKQLRVLNSVVFPVPYSERFYKDVLDLGELARLAYYNDVVVGAVCCRLDAIPESKGLKTCYIMTLGCLAPYRHLGIGTEMLTHILNHCQKDKSIQSIYLHVQVNNETALNFYKKSGFTVKSTEVGYYKRIEPADAYILEKTFTHSD